MKYWREASTLILALRPRCSAGRLAAGHEFKATSIGKNDFRILMLRRSARSSFMPSKVVFPGGVLQEVDHSKDWRNVYTKLTGYSLEDIGRHVNSDLSSTPMILEQRDWALSADIAFRICAIRETFEESGILLATNRELLNAAQNNAVPYRSSNKLLVGDIVWRKKVEKDPFQFMTLCQELGVVPDIWSLKAWRNWLTPVFHKVESAPKKPRRFDTMFYVCCLECDEIPNALADETESTQAEWKGADEYVRAYSNHEPNYPPLAPPQAYELGRISLCQRLEDLSLACGRRSQTGVPRWMPVYRLCKDAILIILPGDFLYPSDPDLFGTHDLPDPYQCSVLELTDETKNMNRITFSSFEGLSVSSVDTTVTNTTDVDSLLQKGTVTCNI